MSVYKCVSIVIKPNSVERIPFEIERSHKAVEEKWPSLGFGAAKFTVCEGKSCILIQKNRSLKIDIIFAWSKGLAMYFNIPFRSCEIDEETRKKIDATKSEKCQTCEMEGYADCEHCHACDELFDEIKIQYVPECGGTMALCKGCGRKLGPNPFDDLMI